MEIALEKLPLEERVSLLKQLWESVKQDDPEALKFVQDEAVMTSKPYRLVEKSEALPYLVVPDDSDKNEFDKLSTEIKDDSIIGFTKGSIKIVGDIVEPTTTDDDWDACR